MSARHPSVETMIEWDSSQQAVLHRAEKRQPDPILVYGTPGSGKSALAAELALRNLTDGYDSARLLLLSPTRQSAARLRNDLEHKIADAGPQGENLSVTEQPSKSFASYAFWLLGEARRLRIEGSDQHPRLLSGAEQDRIIGEIVEAHRGQAEDPSSPWHELLPAFGALTGLRRELRDILDRCREYGISPAQLRAYAVAGAGRRMWMAIADLAENYEQKLRADYPGAYDAATLLVRACHLLEQPIPEAAENLEPTYFWELERKRLNRIIVDDIHEAGPGMHRLLRLIGVDNHLFAFASPDTAVQGFRGARPDALANWTVPVRSADNPSATGSMASADRRSQSAPAVLHLGASHRLNGGIADLYGKVTARIGVVSAVLRAVSPLPLPERFESEAPDFTSGSQAGHVSAYAVALPHLAEQLVLQQILDAHHKEGVPWNRIAVLVRSGSEMRSLGRLLDAHGVAVASSLSETVLHDEPSVEPLLRLLEAAVPAEPSAALAYQDIVSLLGSAYGGVDAIQLRRLHQELLRLDRHLGHDAPTLTQPDDFAELSRAELLLLHAATRADVASQLRATASEQASSKESIFTPLDRLRGMFSAARSALAAEGPATDPEQALWQVWSAAGVAERWQQQAAGTDLAARRANRNLDAVIALFQTAERFIGQHASATVGDFIDYISSLELPMDTLAEAGDQHLAVEVLTPSTAAGREFDTVIIPGLQEGSWPNLQPRGELLGSSDLVTMHQAGPEAVTADPRAKRTQTLQDECRLFAAALSRASRRVTLIAVQSEESSPSSLFDLASPAQHGRNVLTQVPRAIEGRALAAELRGVLERNQQPPAGSATSQRDSDESRTAAMLLAQLAQAGVQGAHPDSWWGYRGQTSPDEPLAGPNQRLRLSPSRVDSAITSPLGWFTAAAGGAAPSTPQQSLGTFVHSIAERYPQASLDTLYDVLDAEWDDFRLGVSWVKDRDKARARQLLRFLGFYYAEAEAKDRVLIATELHLHQHWEVSVGDEGSRTVEVSGKADRIEWAPADTEAGTAAGFYIVDFKTGKSVPGDSEVDLWYPQIDIYRWLAEQGAVGATLHRLLATEEAELQPQEQEAKQNLLTVFALSDISWDPGAGAIRFLADGRPVSVPLQAGPPQDVAGAALVQLGTTNKSLKLQQAGAGAAERAPDQLRQAAEVMTGSRFHAYHPPGQASCYAGLLCPLCRNGRQVSEP